MSAGLTEGNATDQRTGTAGALNADAIASVDVNDFQAGFVQITGTFSGTLTFQGSDDGTNYLSVQARNVSNLNDSPITTTTVAGLFYFPTPFRYFRLRMTAYTSGSAVATAFFQRVPTEDIGARKAQLTDGTDLAGITQNGDLKVVDGLRNGGVYGALNIPTINVPVEAKVGASRLAQRKTIIITIENNGIFWGLDSSVTTTSGNSTANGQVLTFNIDPDSTFQIWLVGNANNKNVHVTEIP